VLRSRGLAILCTLLVLRGTPLAGQAGGARAWNGWPWMSAEIPPSVQLSARTVLIGATRAFQGILVFHNTSSDSVRVRFGSCSFGLRLYADDTGLGSQPLWDNRPGPNADCTLVGHEVMLGPKEPREQAVSFGFGLLTQPPAPGRFFATITWRPSNDAPVRDVAAGWVVIR
jgi:hypothetical protein